MNGRQKVQEGINRVFQLYLESRMLSTRNARNELRKTHHSNEGNFSSSEKKA